jgi:two-component system chemotaxis response regulator CheB
MAKRDIIVVGGSAGSTEPLRELMAGLPRDFPASIFITTHLPSLHESYLAEVLGRAGEFPVRTAVDGRAITPGQAYVAAADRHLLLIDSAIRLGFGPRENMVRPAIDPMFRSAALTFGPRAVGVILSGKLSDGASGLFAIKQAGGTTIVQKPADAQEDSMPRAALAATAPDHIVAAADLPRLLVEVAGLDAGPSVKTPDSLVFEVEVAAGAPLGTESLRRFAEPAALTCPDCGGVLSEMRGQQPLRYRCQIGHAYTAAELAAKHETVDEAIRIALRVMEERTELVARMARDARATSRNSLAELYEQRAAEYGRHAGALREAAILSMRIGRAAEEPSA